MTQHTTDIGYLVCYDCGNTSFTIQISRDFFVVDQIEDIICANCGSDHCGPSTESHIRY